MAGVNNVKEIGLGHGRGVNNVKEVGFGQSVEHNIRTQESRQN